MIETLRSVSLMFANTSSAVGVMRDYLSPILLTFGTLAGVVASLVLVFAGYLYITSSGKPDEMDKAKRLIKNALTGLVVVLAASAIVGLLMSSYGEPAGGKEASLPRLEALEAGEVDNGLVDVLIKAITGFLNNIIQAVAVPFLAGLEYFTSSTPLMSENSSVFNLWLMTLAIANTLLVLVLVLIGFQIMGAGMLGFEEVSLKQMLPRVGLIFLLMNSSILIIDGFIRLSNVLIAALSSVAGANAPWETLTSVVESTGSQGMAALLLMLVFLIFTVFLLVYYVMRLVTLFIGAVLAPMVLLLWLVPGFRDFSETAIKTYLTTVFVLFVHTIILLLASSLFTGMASIGPNQLPDTLMSLILGLATIIALLRTQGVMMQFSFVSMGARNTRMLGGQFVNGVSYLGSKGGMALSRAGGLASAGASYGSSRFRGSPMGAGMAMAAGSRSMSGSSSSSMSSFKSSSASSTGKSYGGRSGATHTSSTAPLSRSTNPTSSINTASSSLPRSSRSAGLDSAPRSSRSSRPSKSSVSPSPSQSVRVKNELRSGYSSKSGSGSSLGSSSVNSSKKGSSR